MGSTQKINSFLFHLQIIYFSAITFAKMNLEHLSVPTIVIVGIVNVISTTIAVAMVDVVGRRCLLIFSFAAMLMDMLALSACYVLDVNLK